MLTSSEPSSAAETADPIHLLSLIAVSAAWQVVLIYIAARPSKREVVRSLMSATDSETAEEDLERDYNKLAPHPKGNFARFIRYIPACI